MIKEFAVEPAYLLTPNVLPFIYASFGVVNGRVISRFPKKWLKQVFDLSDTLNPSHKKLIEVGLEIISKRKILVSSNREFESSLDWLENAIQIHTTKPFRAIIAMANQNGEDFILTHEDINKDADLFKSERSRIVQRNAQDICDCVIPLISHSKQIILVDRYLQEYNDRHIGTLSGILKWIKLNRACAIKKIQYHTGDRETDENYIKSRLSPSIPKNMKIEIVLWPTDKLHNRFILTDIGGLQFGHGLDEDQSYNSTSEDDVSILDSEHYLQRWNKYNNVSYLSYTIEGTMEKEI